MKKTKKALASLAIAGMALTMVPFNAFADTTASTRLSGNTAVQTSQAISQNYLTSSQYAVVAPASAYNMVDALAAAPLAATLKAPVLLTAGDQLSPEVKSEITRLGVKTVYVTSGSSVIKAGVIADLQGLGVQVINLGGYDQYETSVNIAKVIGNLNPTTSLFIANGEAARVAQDALSVASVAGAQKQPLLLTQKGQLPKVVADYIDSIKAKVTSSYITGGTGVVSDEVKAQLPGTVYRNAGNDAYDTNLAVLENFSSFDFDRVFVANGETMVDALAGAPLAAQTNSPVVLVNGSVKTATTDFLKTKVSSTTVVTALGGEAVVPEYVRTAVANPTQLNVTTVAGTTSSVYESKGDQVLGISINGNDMSLSELAAAGYTVEFQATSQVFLGGDDQSTDGVLSYDLTAGDEFSYIVNVLKAGEVVATSASKHVNVKAQDAGSSVIDAMKVYLTDDSGVKVTSGKISTDDDAVIKVLGTLADDSYGTVTDKMNYTSSDPSIAYVVKDTAGLGYFHIQTGDQTGSVTITATATDGTKSTLNLTVVDGVRKPSASNTVVSATSLKLGTGATSGVAVIVKDQFGDPVKGEALETTNPEDGDGILANVHAANFDATNWTQDASSISGTPVTDVKGRAFIYATSGTALGDTAISNIGTGTFKIKDDSGNTLKSISFTGAAASSASKYKLNLQPFTSATLDASDSDAQNTYVKFDAYDSNDDKIGSGIDLDSSNTSYPGAAITDPTYTVKIDGSTDTSDYVTVAWDATYHRMKISSGTKTKSGSVEVAVYESGIKRASISVVPGDTRVAISSVKFESNFPTISSTSAYDLSDFIEESGITTADGSPVYFESDNDKVYIEGVDGTVLGVITAAVTEGDLDYTLTQDDLTVTTSGTHEDGKLVLTVKKLSGAADGTFTSTRLGTSLDIPGNSTYVGSKTISVSDLG